MEACGVTMEIGSFVALGDSFTEGLDDPAADRSGYLGWADRFALRLAQQRPGHNEVSGHELSGPAPGLRYANLAVRGKLLSEVAAEQVPRAIAMAPDLVSIAAGGNDMLRPRADPDTLAEAFDEVVATLLAAGCPVLIFTGFDPRFPVLRLIRGKVAAYNMHLRAIAGRHQCHVVDLWSMNTLRDPRAWSADRLHLSADGHRRVALRACEVMGVAVDEDWRERWPSQGGTASRYLGWLAARQMDARWARQHAAPWVSRRLRGVSSGDGVQPKRPELGPVHGWPEAASAP
jgi:lysophospholipase L1-like esterase